LDSIAELSAALARGDDRAIELFYRRWFDWLFGQARRATGRDESFCLDVVQESLLRILRSVRTVECEARFRAWLGLVVQSTAYDLLRSEQRRRQRERRSIEGAGANDAEAASADREALDAERLRWLQSQVQRLDPTLARLIEMRFERQWTLTRIGKALGLSVGTVDGRLRRLLSDLRHRAEDEFRE
jgi:RNA polymerase sigma factor (sigma-70 family)